MREEGLQKHQAACLKALLPVAKALEEQGIPFYLIEGSALGAVRHQGLIPWDDDIDIGVFRKDFRRAALAIEEVLPLDFNYTDRVRDPDFPRFFGKVIDVSTGRGCIDLFPLIATSKKERLRKKQWKRRKVYFKLYKAKIGYANEREKEGLKNRLKLAFARFFSAFHSREGILQRIEENELWFETEELSPYYVNLYGAYTLEQELIDGDWIAHPKEVIFAGKTYRTMGDPDAYLTRLYGDYWAIPEEKDRAVRHDESFG